ncbi:hypothetical protein [Aquabacterium sp.]|uniref:hypothetical protein n=1 Tax=Aquabacterium sp. TaxID=1872578 RepID=UPI002C15F332|nr:hypothetical protein [Aquabacterium sp.]HSW06158.1 hypothetical protein [Aquabacterium sp.]
MLRSHIFRLFVVSLALLASCGGGRDSSEPRRGTLDAPRTAVVDSNECSRQPSRMASMLAHRVVNGECLRSFTGFDKRLAAGEQRRRALAVVSPRTPTVTELFDWAELSYAQYFPSHQANRTLGAYTYRYYPETQNHTAVDGEMVYVQGPVSGGGLAFVGRLADFACLVFPDSCGPQPVDCAAVTSWAVGANTCRPNAEQNQTIPSGASFAYTDSGGSTRGTATYSCTEGTLTVLGTPVCDLRVPLACNTTPLSWTVGSNVCTANAGEPTQLASGASHTFQASTGNVGAITYACDDGDLKPSGTAACAPPTPVVCRPTSVSWTVSGNTCHADSVPAEIAGGGTYSFFDAVGVPTGYSIRRCTEAGLVGTGDENCVAVPHIQDSFGGDGGAADGGASGDGTAGDGAPIVGGLVTVVDMTGKQASATTDSIGYYRVKLTGFVPPFVLSVTRPDGKVRRSINQQPIKTNGYIFMAITGLTDKIASDVAQAAGFPGAASLTPAMVAANPNAVTAAINAIRNDPLLREQIDDAGLNPDTFDPLTVPFRANGTGYDKVLDNIVVTTNASGATVVESLTCRAPLSWTVSGVTCTPDSGEETVITSGSSVRHNDTLGSTLGSVTWACSKGVLQPAIRPECMKPNDPPPSQPTR